MKRRKWTYRTREDAETAARELGMMRDYTSVALNAIVNGETIKLDGKYGDEDAYYTFAVVPRWSMPIVIVTFHCPHTGQRAHTACYPETWVSEEIARWSNAWPIDDQQRAYRDGLYKLRALVQEKCAEWCAA